jgi:TfoX/Sxy family transcriptional regulator of competence genes
MAYNELLSARIANVLESKGVVYEAKKMMGGICYMVDDKMCVGVHQDRVMGRIGPHAYEDALAIDGCEKMMFTKREMKGYVFVHPQAYDHDDQLSYWVDLCLEFNPEAKSSKKRNKK